MKNVLFILLVTTFLIGQSPKLLKPYILGIKSDKSLSETRELVKNNLKANGLNILGEYSPAEEDDRWVIIIGSSELTASAKEIGGLTGFAGALRVAITKEDNMFLVTYTNPIYWGNAYYRDDYQKVENNFIIVFNKLIRSMKASGTFIGTYFGSEKGISDEDLSDYQYMFGMPDFDDVVELEEFDSYTQAKATLDANLKKGVENVELVYALEIPGKNLKLYGIALNGEDGERKFLPKIDIGTPKHTAFLPYEILINDNEVVMLHGRYRIALSFPDLTMKTFTKIMSAPGDIVDAMEKICKSE